MRTSFEIPCPGCGKRLRVQSENTHKKHRCPVCETFVVPEPWRVRMRERRTLAWLCGSSALLGLVPFTWPVGWWLLTAAILLWCLESAYSRLNPVSSEPRGLPALLAVNCLKGLRDAGAGVAVGLGVICVAQCVLRSGLLLATPETIRASEDWVVEHRSLLAEPLKFQWLLAAAGVLLIASLFTSTSPALVRYKRLRTWASRALVTATTVSAFTFLTPVSIDALDREWVAGRRTELERDAAKVKEGRATLVALAQLKLEIARLPDESRQQVARLFRDAARDPEAATFVRDLGERLGRHSASTVAARDTTEPPPVERLGAAAAPVDTAAAAQRRRAVDEALERLEAPEPRRGPARDAPRPPSIKDGPVLAAEATRLADGVAVAQMTVEKAVETLIGAPVTAGLDPLVGVFVKSVIGSGVKVFLAEAVPRGIDGFDRALQWATVNLRPQNDERGSAFQVQAVFDAAHPPRVAKQQAAAVADAGTRRVGGIFSSDDGWLTGALRRGGRTLPGDSEIAAIREGLASGWAVSRNAAGAMFVHEQHTLRGFEGLRYLIRESVDGGTWTIYEPGPQIGGRTLLGRRVGDIQKPSSVIVEPCTCR